MDIITLFSHLETVVQLALVIGFVAVVFLVACSRRSAENLLLFLRGLRSVMWPAAREEWQKPSWPHQALHIPTQRRRKEQEE